MARLKVLFITAWYPTKENPVAGMFVREHAKAVQLYDDVMVLHCAGADPHVKALWSLEEETLVSVTEKIPTYMVRHRPLPIPPASYLLYLWSVLQAFRRIVSEGFRPDIIHAHIYEGGLPAVLIGKLFRLPVVVTEHWSAFPLRYLSRTGRLRANVAFRLADVVLPVSESLQAGIESYGIKANFSVVPNAVDTTVFYPNSTERIPTDPIRLLFVGYLKPVKGIPYLLQALTLFRQKRDHWRLDIVGEGEWREEYENLSRELGLSDRVTFHGLKSKPEVAEFMRQSDLLVHPSLWETFGCTLAEAMSCGLAVVASDVGGVPEVIDKGSGLLCEAKSSKSLGAALGLALDQLPQFDRRRTVIKASEHYSLQVVGQAIHSVYASCVD